MKDKIMHVMNEIMETLEFILAALILLVIILMIGLNIWQLVSHPQVFLEENFLHHFLGNITTLVVAVEFLKMLLRPTVGNTVELLIMAISRYVVLNHHDYIAIVVGIASIVALFAARRFLVTKPSEDNIGDA